VFVILLGPPGAGKGTQARLLAQGLGVPVISTGDLFREQITADTPLGREVAEFINRGDLVPDTTTLQVLRARLGQANAARGAVFDGFPRTVAQAEALDRLLHERSARLTRVVDFEVEEAELLRRLGGRWTCRNCHTTYHEIAAPPRVAGVCDRCAGELYQRPDDTPEAVKVRLQVYNDRTLPLIEYYRAAGVLRTIDAAQSRDRVTRALIEAVDGAAPRD
jgi:adenylate kinase